MVTRGRAAAQAFAGRRGRRPLRFAREWATAGACPSSGPAGPPSPEGEGKGCCWRRRKPPRGVGDAAPYGLPGNGRQGEPAPHPALRGHLPPRGKARAVVGGSGRPRRGGGTPPYVWGDMEALWGLREQSFPGRRAVGAGHARPGGLRRQASMVRSVGRGLDPSAGGCPGDGCWREISRGVGDAAPYGLPGNGGDGSLPLIRPCGATFPRGGRQGLLLAAGDASPYPGSWSSVRSWRVRL